MTKDKNLTISNSNSTYPTTSQGDTILSSQEVRPFKFIPNPDLWRYALQQIKLGDVKKAEDALRLYRDNFTKTEEGLSLYQRNMAPRNDFAFKSVGDSPLALAIKSENPDMVSLVIKYGAIPNIIQNGKIEAAKDCLIMHTDSVKSEPHRYQIRTI